MPSHDCRTRSIASDALMAIAQEHEAARSDIVALLTTFLGPAAEADASGGRGGDHQLCHL